LKPAAKADADGWTPYRGTFLPPDTGRFTLTIRATPHHPEMIHMHELGLITWLSHDNAPLPGTNAGVNMEPSHADA
jgi:hypothetical protein